MSPQQKTVLAKKRRGPPPTGKGLTVGVRLQPELLAKLDNLRAAHSPAPSRPEAIRQILEAAFKLTGQG